MSLQVEKLEKNMAKLTIEASAEDFEKAIQKVYLKARGRINIPGFRKGKAPRKLIEKMYGTGVFYEDAANDLIPTAYAEALKDCDLEIVSRPEINVTQIESGKPFIFTAEVAVKPEVTLGEYKGVEVEKSNVEVTDEDINKEVDKERENNSRTIDVDDRAVESGDIIKLDFDGSVDGVPFAGGKAENYTLTIGSGSFIPGFEDQLIGTKIGEDKDVTVTFPADASPNTKEKAPETDIINKETTAETETETKEETEVPVKNSSKKTTLSTEKSTEKKTPLKKETENETETESESETSSETATETETEITAETESKTETETESQTPGVTPEEESELASEGIRTETRSTEKDSELKYYLTSQYLLVPSFKNLKKDLNEMIDTYEGSWSIYVKDLKSGISLTINDRPQDSASLIKLYIAGAVLEEIQSQELEETDTIDQLLSDMISLSDNEAANELVRYLSDSHDHRDGMEKVNDFIEEHDFTDTHQYNGLEDSNLWYGDEANVTSVKDCGRFLEEIYDGDMVSHLASRQLEGYLLNQDITWKIPAGIPSEIKTANKTGEKDNTQNDVSIVYTPYRDYIICVMATDLTDEDTAVENIRAVSGKVYEFFQEADTVTTENETESETEGGSSDVSDVGEDLEG